MTHMRRTLVATLAALTALQAENWPNWRGPRADGTSAEKSLPTTWNQTTNITWKLAMPEVSGSTPVVWGDTIFLSNSDGGSIQIWSVDRNKGTVKWKAKVADSDDKVRKGNMSSPSPVTDGKTVWAMSGNGQVRAFDFSGKELWHRDMWKDYGRFGLNHGYGRC